MRWYLIVLLIYISLVISDLNTFSCTCWSFVCLLWENVCSDPLSSVQFTCSVVSYFLRPQEMQHARPPCPSPAPRVYPNWCPLSWWCHLTISSSVFPFSSCLHYFPASGVFSNESVLHIRWPKYCSFSFSISASNDCSGLIISRIDWLDLLSVQGTLKCLQHHSSKASILRCSAFFIVQLSHRHMTTKKTIDLTRWTFVGKVMSLLFTCYLGCS